MADVLRPRSASFDMSTTPEDDGSFTLPKLKAASESLRRFNDALLRIGEAEAEASDTRPSHVTPASFRTAKPSP